MGEYKDTNSALARQVGCTAPTITLYANLGLLDYIRISNGIRLFRTGQADRVKSILAQRLASRGRRPSEAA
jgi:DNA-binding transcriptional MerR regulator